jgi:hypothetical protein
VESAPRPAEATSPFSPPCDSICHKGLRSSHPPPLWRMCGAGAFGVRRKGQFRSFDTSLRIGWEISMLEKLFAPYIGVAELILRLARASTISTRTMAQILRNSMP